MREELTTSLFESLLRSLPVDHIPDGAKVLGLAILVLQIVGVLPSINTQQWSVLSQWCVLVGITLDSNVTSLSVLHKPCPAGALDGCKSSVELFLQTIETAIALSDTVCQRT